MWNSTMTLRYGQGHWQSYHVKAVVWPCCKMFGRQWTNEAKIKDANPLVAEPETDFNATSQNGHSGLFKVISFRIIEELLRWYIAKYNKCGLRCEGSEDIASKRSKNRYFRPPHSHLKSRGFAGSPANPRKYPHKNYLTRHQDPWATFLPLTVWVYLPFKF